MKIFVFLGPSLRADLAREELDAVYLPPAGQGDVYRAVRERPFAIGLIDGYFERVPAVWHKEILWALQQRIHVYGAASMGALRAAELDRFGMRGVGAIYQAFRSGELTDDDEVAVAHEDASAGFRATSEAMVNIRATLLAAEEAGVLPPEAHGGLVQVAKSLFYPERTYPAILKRARDAGVDPHVLSALEGFLPAGRVNRKQQDARLLLGALAECRAQGEPPPPASFPFFHTEAWDQVVDWGKEQPPLGASRMP